MQLKQLMWKKNFLKMIYNIQERNHFSLCYWQTNLLQTNTTSSLFDWPIRIITSSLSSFKVIFQMIYFSINNLFNNNYLTFSRNRIDRDEKLFLFIFFLIYFLLFKIIFRVITKLLIKNKKRKFYYYSSVIILTSII